MIAGKSARQVEQENLVANEGDLTKILGKDKIVKLCRKLKTQFFYLPDLMEINSRFGEYIAAMQVAPTMDVVLISANGVERLIKQGQSRLYVDGTHGVVDHFQVVAMLIENEEGHGEPVAHLLTSSHSAESYEYFFQHIQRLTRGELNPASMMCDYEKAIEIAAKNVWPNIAVHGCYFHFKQAIVKKLRIDVPDEKQRTTVLQYIDDVRNQSLNHEDVVKRWQKAKEKIFQLSPEFCEYVTHAAAQIARISDYSVCFHSDTSRRRGLV